MNSKWRGIGFALLAAALFGLSTPLAKRVSPFVEPVLLAGLLYVASGAGLGVYSLSIGTCRLSKTSNWWSMR